MLKFVTNIFLKNFFLLIFLFLITSFYYLLSASLILFVLLTFLFILMNFYLILSLNLELFNKVNLIKIEFEEISNNVIKLLLTFKNFLLNVNNYIYLQSTFFSILIFKQFLYKFININSNIFFLNFFKIYYFYLFKLNKIKKNLIL